jgi:hypothetical protein
MVRSIVLLSFVAGTIALATTLLSTPAAAQMRVPANGEAVECPINAVFDGTAFVVTCTDRWGGMLVPLPRVNGWSGFMFCGPIAADYICYTGATIDVAEHPEPLKSGFLTCTADWDAFEEVPAFACKQE